MIFTAKPMGLKRVIPMLVRTQEHGSYQQRQGWEVLLLFFNGW